ncbi:hypothetical protein DPMN_090491 [Dreissena polymorpha]|uniref:Uncharacterized protein n=1 Tax=Dreissena polymorpha TaxID=45954 RepID=A0A9D4L0A0_DREPO|nr:hypothetical protein DPMN_090491 [Dreissena polymorpha]
MAPYLMSPRTEMSSMKNQTSQYPAQSFCFEFMADEATDAATIKCAAKVMMVRKTGKQNGVQARIQAIVVRAVYTHCKAHWLNHANIHASDSMHAKNMMATALTIASAIDYSAKRLLRFYENLETDAMGT